MDVQNNKEETRTLEQLRLKLGLRRISLLLNIFEKLRVSQLSDYVFPISQLNGIISILKTRKRIAKAEYPISLKVYNYILEQKERSKELIDLIQVAKDNDLNYNQLLATVNDMYDNNSALYKSYFETNCFNFSNHYYLMPEREHNFIHFYFAKLVMSNHKQHAFVRTNNVAMNSKSKFIEVYRLEQVQDENSKKGRVLGFATDRYNKLTPIVGFYNGKLRFANNLQHSPRTSGSLRFKEFKGFSRRVTFEFKLSEVLNKGKQRYLNLFLRAMEGKCLEVQVNIHSDTTGLTGKVRITASPTYINVEGLDRSKTDTVNVKSEKDKAYGPTSGKKHVTNEDLIEYFNEHAFKSNHSCLKMTNRLPNPIHVTSTAYPFRIEIDSAEDAIALQKAARKQNQKIGEYIMHLAKITGNGPQLNFFEKQGDQAIEEEQEKVYQQAGKRLFAHRKVTYLPDKKVVARKWLFSNIKDGKYKIDIINLLNSNPVILAEIADLINGKTTLSKLDVTTKLAQPKSTTTEEDNN